MRRYIVTCDDCGLSEGINTSAVALQSLGVNVAPSVMTNMRAAKHALVLFAASPALQPGVHLNLTEGFPLATLGSKSTLTRHDGRFHPRRVLFWHSVVASRAFRSQAARELEAQVIRFMESGGRPGHLTTHIQFHWFASLRTIVYDLADRFEIPWVRAHSISRVVLPNLPFRRQQPTPQSSFPNQPAIPSQKPRTPDYLVPIKEWLHRPPDQLRAEIMRLEGTVEIVVHPCTPDDPTFPPENPHRPHERYAEVRYLERLVSLFPEIASTEWLQRNSGVLLQI